MLGEVGRRDGDGNSGGRCGSGGAVRGDVGHVAAAAADADAKARPLDLDFGQAGFVEQPGELADQLLIDRGLAVGVALVFGRHAQRLLLVFVSAARPSIASA